MAITYVGAGTADSRNTSGDVFPTPHASTLIGDFMLLSQHRNDELGTFEAVTGFTEIHQQNPTTGQDRSTGLWYRIATADAPGAVTCGHTDAGSEQYAAQIETWRGVDGTTPFDVTFAAGSHLVNRVNKASPNVDAFQSITTVTDGAFVVAVEMVTHDDITSNADPSGYTNGFRLVGTSHQHRQIQSWHREIATAGAETPGAPAYTSSMLTAESSQYTLALRPAGGADVTITLAGSTSLTQTDQVPIHAGQNGASFSTALNTALEADVSSGNVNFRVILLYQNDGSPLTPTMKVRYSKNSGAYADITGVSNNVQLFNDSNLTNGADSVQLIGSGTFEANNNGILDTSATFTPAALATAEEGECEISGTLISADLADTDTIHLLLHYSDNTPVGPQTQVALINITKTGGTTTVTLAGEDGLTVSHNSPTVGSGASSSPTADALTVSDNVPTASTGASSNPTNDSLVVADNIPTVASGKSVSSPSDSATEVDNAPEVFTGASIAGLVDALTETDNTPTASTGVLTNQNSDSLTLVDNAPEVKFNARVYPDEDTLIQTDNIPEVVTGASVDVGVDNLVLSHNAPTVGSGARVDVPLLELTQTDNEPRRLVDVVINVPCLEMSISHQDPIISTGVVVSIPSLSMGLITYAPISVGNNLGAREPDVRLGMGLKRGMGL